MQEVLKLRRYYIYSVVKALALDRSLNEKTLNCDVLCMRDHFAVVTLIDVTVSGVTFFIAYRKGVIFLRILCLPLFCKHSEHMHTSIFWKFTHLYNHLMCESVVNIGP